MNRSDPRRDARRRLAPMAGCLVTLTVLSCADPLVFADWTIPVAEDTPTFEYPGVSAADRAGNHIELVEELVIRGDGNEPAAFYQPFGALNDDAGRVYVVDLAETRIQAYGASGAHLRSLGGEGSGPGEFRGARGGWVTILATLAGEHVVAYDLQQSRIFVWNADGGHLGDRILDELRLSSLLGGGQDQTLVAVAMARTEAGSREAVVAVDFEGRLRHTYVSLPRPPNLELGARVMSDPSGEPVFAVAADGTVYATAGDEYQLLAIEPDGAERWALRVAHERIPLTDADRSRILDRLSMGGTHEVDDNDTNWPSRIGSISRLAVDGHGHLYVYGSEPPYADGPPDVDVDVFSAQGERLFSGTMPRVRWTSSAGDHVVAIRTDQQTDEREVVRYRLVEPF